MCGLVGVAGNTNLKVNKVFRNLLLFDQLRGFDSTGVGVVGVKDDKMVVEKEVGIPNDLWLSSKLLDARGIPEGFPRVLMGHNRAATIGKVTKENAHPFNFGHITGAHNGTLRVYDDLHGNEVHDVDSKALFHNIEQNGIHHTWENFAGAAAITYWDDRDATISLVRNAERPLHLCYLSNHSAIAWASEKWMLEAALAQVGMAPSPLKEMDDIFMLRPNWLHVFKPKSLSVSLEKTEELKAKKFLPGFTFGGRGKATKIGGQRSTVKTGTGDTFNFRWTSGLPKAEKKHIGRMFNMESARSFTSYPRNSAMHIITCRFLDDPNDQFQLYPTSYEEWEAFAASLRAEDTKDNVYKLIRRPRYRPTVSEGLKPWIYAGSTPIIELVSGIDPLSGVVADGDKEYLTFTNQKTTDKTEAQDDLDLAGGSCGYCDKALTVDDEYEFQNSGSVVICKECCQNADQFPWIGHNSYGVN